MDSLAIWAGLWMWLAALWVALWQGIFLYRIMNIMGKNPKMTPFFLTLSILWVALVESSAIYWLVVSFQLLSAEFTNPLASVWVGLAIWLTWFWVGYWEWTIVEWASTAINKRPEERNAIMSFMILFIALVESCAIFGLIIAFQILWNKEIWALVSAWVGLAIWLSWIWVSIWEWILVKKAMDGIWEHWLRDNKLIIPFSILWIALIESCVIYGLIVSLNIMTLPAEKWILAIWASLAVWLAAVWVALWGWRLIWESLSKLWLPWVSWKAMIPTTILWMALVESAAIYWLVVAFQITSADPQIWLNWLWSGLSIWLAALWFWIWAWNICTKAMSAMSIKDAPGTKIITFMVLYIALIESIAIFGLMLAFNLIWASNMELWAIWVWLSIWLAWLWVAIWESFVWGKSLMIMSKRPELWTFLVTVTVLWIALVESWAIYWLIISYQIISSNLHSIAALWVWLSIWLSTLWAWLALGHLISWAFNAIARNPEYKARYLSFMILFVALVEVLAIYWLIVSMQILSK